MQGQQGTWHPVCRSVFAIRCSRCGIGGEVVAGLPPEGWVGTAFDTVCPGCQEAERLGRRRPQPLGGGWAGQVEWCDHVDVEHGYPEDDWPETWTCPKCGGTDFEMVQLSGDGGEEGG
jgi:hypothetical protein